MPKTISFNDIIEALLLLKPYNGVEEYQQFDDALPGDSDIRTFYLNGLNTILFRSGTDFLIHYFNVLLILYPNLSEAIGGFRKYDLMLHYDECMQQLNNDVFNCKLTKQPILESFLKNATYASYYIRPKATLPIIAKLCTIIKLADEL